MSRNLEFLLRKNKGKRLLPDYINELQQAGLNSLTSDAFLTLEDSDLFLMNRQENHKEIANEKFEKNTQFEDLCKYLSVLTTNYSIKRCYFFTNQSYYCGLLFWEEEFKDTILLNLLNNDYIGGYFILMNDYWTFTFDKNEDYGRDNIYQWIYTISVKSVG